MPLVLRFDIGCDEWRSISFDKGGDRISQKVTENWVGLPEHYYKPLQKRDGFSEYKNSDMQMTIQKIAFVRR